MINSEYIKRKVRHLKRKSRQFDGQISKNVIGSYLPPNPIILEAGAHVGDDTIAMLDLWKDATLYAFEPIPDLYAKLESRVGHYSRAHTYQLGLSDKSGKSKIYVSSGASDASSSILKPKKHLEINPAVKFNKTITIETVTVSDWIKESAINRIDFMWLDLQGMELSVLKHVGPVLDTVKVILAEVSLIETYENVPQVDELKKFMKKRGFTAKLEETPYPDMGDILFVKRG